jgi:hypothetical protein
MIIACPLNFQLWKRRRRNSWKPAVSSVDLPKQNNGVVYLPPTAKIHTYHQPFGILIFWRTRRYKSIYNLKIDTIEMLLHHSIDAFFFSALKQYVTCHAICWQKARTKSKDIDGSDRLTGGCVCQRVKKEMCYQPVCFHVMCRLILKLNLWGLSCCGINVGVM